MKHLLLIGMVLSALSCQTDPQTSSAPVSDSPSESTFDAAYAAKLGADEYGMSQYVIAFLKTGPNRETDQDKATALQKAHMDNIGRMAEAGQVVLAGPFLDDGDLRGIYIFNVATVDEAKALTETDPMIQSGHLIMELHPWYGSAGVKAINDIHKRITKTDI